MRKLVVVVPSIRGGLDTWSSLLERLKAEPGLADAHWLLWDHRLKWYSAGHPKQLANDLRARIDQEWTSPRGPFEEVLLVGHSIGGLLVRQAYLLAAGAEPSRPRRSDWVTDVTRMILFAAVNRGVEPRRTSMLRVANWLGRVLPPFRRMVAWHLFRGSDFITNMRIQWIRHFAGLGDKAPVVVQFLGTRDQLVTADDSIDVEQFKSGFYKEIPEATHGDLHRLDAASDPEGRYAMIRDAFVNPQPHLAANREFHGEEQIVFILHGIRANNRTWVQQTASDIRTRWPGIKTIAPQYGYFSAFRFAVPLLRRKNLRWFQDEYTEALARNPQATFDFIGHSNGTYMLGESLRAIPGMRFRRAALVGSVLPADYSWDVRFRQQQIESLRVDGSCYDWPVGWLCRSLRAVGMKDVGTGGFEGFTRSGPPTHEFFWYAGGHSAPLDSANLPALAEYAVEGSVRAPAKIGHEVAWFARVGRGLSWIAPLAALAAVAAFVYLLFVQPFIALVAVAALLALIFLLDIV